MKEKYFKVYYKDKQNRQKFFILNTEKSYQEVESFLGKCEELFESDVKVLKDSDVKVIHDFSTTL